MRLRASGLFVALASFFVAPSMVSAGVPFWGPIIPTDYNVCAANWGLVIVVINNIISLGITLAIAIVAPLSFAYAGFLLLTSGGDPGKRGQARRAITNVVVGVVVALASYLIVAALMAVLYHPDDPRLAGKTWADLVIFGGTPMCIDLAASLNQTETGGDITGVDEGGGVRVVPPVGPEQYTHAEALAVLQQHGSISVVSSGGCSDPTNPRCTSLHGIPRDAVTRITEIQTACNCGVTITAGTETGHKSHGVGLPIVDFSYTASLLEGIRAVGYTINARFGRGATCEPPQQPGVAMTCGPGTGHIHMEL